LLGIQDLAPKENPTIQSTTDFDTDGFETVEKTVTAATLTAKIRHIINSGTASPGQELARVAGQYQFADAVRLYVRWYDRNSGPEAWQMRAIVDWTASKTAAPDIEEVTISFRGDGTVTSLSPNPAAAGNPAPVITAATPSGQGAGQMVRITGAYFTGTTAAQVKFGATAATSIDVISDSTIEAILPSGTAGAANITVANAAGTSTAFSYTRAA
jgi:hypothetical protein